jgi:hypothetical protein
VPTLSSFDGHTRKPVSLLTELTPAYPAFKDDGLLACGPKEEPVAVDTPDLVNTKDPGG